MGALCTCITRFGLAFVIALGLVAVETGTARASDGGAARPGQEEPTEPTVTSGPCPTEELQIVEKYGAPVRGAQAIFNVIATDEGPGSVGLEVEYEDSIGRTTGYTRLLPRPVAAEVYLPEDKRGVTNVVKVSARVIGDPRGVVCLVDVVNEGGLMPLEQLCFERTGLEPWTPHIEFPPYSTPQGGVQIAVDFEARPGVGVGFIAWMTNSKENESKVGDFQDWEPYERQTVLLPQDGRGVYNVIKAEFRMPTGAWYNVLRCGPSIRTGGGLSQLESTCFAGDPVTLTSDSPEPAWALVTLEARPAFAGIAVQATAYRSNNTSRSFGTSVGVPDTGLPRTVIGLPASGTGVSDVIRWTIKAKTVEWPSLLACSPAVGYAPKA